MNEGNIKRALLSVSDKTGIVEFARSLKKNGCEIISTGGTLKQLRDAGIQARSVSDVTGFPELLDGRVKTLHPKIQAGILAVADNASHTKELEELDIQPIDLIVVNLYPFRETAAAENVSVHDVLEQIDIGGVSLLRAAAKNFKSKTVIVDPTDYDIVLEELERNNGETLEATRLKLARKAFHHTAAYDSVIAEYFDGIAGEVGNLPQIASFSWRKSFDLRYGENPHQQAALYGEFESIFETLHGKKLSFNNIVDIQAAAELVEEFDEPAVAIIKHTNPCGVATGTSLAEAYKKALATDRASAFGGIVCMNRPVDEETAACIDSVFTEVVIAPAFPADVLKMMMKKKDRRLVCQRNKVRDAMRLIVQTVAGGVLVQTPDDILLDPEKLRVVTKRIPTDLEHASMMFAWRVTKHAKSNAVVYARPDRTIGIGVGQMSRVDSSRLAVMKANDAGLEMKGTAVASDAFFPFADGLLEAAKAGATAIIQPGGSIRDDEVISAADEHEIAMIFTGIRHFKH